MRKTTLKGKINNRKNLVCNLIAALAVWVFLAACIFTFFVPPVSASPNWVSANGCWTATTGNQTLVMWNATGLKSWKAPAAILSNVWYLVVAGGVQVEELQ